MTWLSTTIHDHNQDVSLTVVGHINKHLDPDDMGVTGDAF
jgi:hypothetical protein